MHTHTPFLYISRQYIPHTYMHTYTYACTHRHTLSSVRNMHIIKRIKCKS